MIFPEEGELVYKDVSLLEFNRLSNLVKENDSDDEPVPSEIIIVDTRDGDNCFDEEP